MKSAVLAAAILFSSLAFSHAADAKKPVANPINGLPNVDPKLVKNLEPANKKIERRSDNNDETVYGTLPPPAPETENKPQRENQEPRPIVHMNKKQKDEFVRKVKKAGPGMKKRLLKFLYRQREDDIAELKERLGAHAEWPTPKPKNGPNGQPQQ